MPLTTCGLRYRVARAFPFTGRQEEVAIGSGIQILVILCYLDMLQMGALSQYTRSQF